MAASGISYPIRTPAWTLTYAGSSQVANDIAPILIDLSYTDKTEKSAEEFEVTLADREKRWQGPWFPDRGDTITATIGYRGERMLRCGTFQVDEVELKGPPDQVHIKAIATGITPDIRTARTMGYEPGVEGGRLTLLDVAGNVARRHNLTLVGAPEPIDVSFDRLTQHKETDLQFLQRLAVEHNYTFSIKGNELIFFSRTTLESQPPVLALSRHDCISFQFKIVTNLIFATGNATYQVADTKTLSTATVDSPTPTPTKDVSRTINRAMSDQHAQLKANAALHETNKEQMTGTIETIGNVALLSGNSIMVGGFGKFSGQYYIDQARHRLDRSRGYTTEVSFRNLPALTPTF